MTHWHYSRRVPRGKLVKIGVWEDARYIGCVIFSMGASSGLAQHHRLRPSELCELTRVALTTHRAPVSRIVAIALKMLRRLCPGLRLVVSFSDLDQGHLGTIYQAGGWHYVGVRMVGAVSGFMVRGRYRHTRAITVMAGWHASLPWLRANIDPHAEKVFTKGRHKYVYLFDSSLRSTLATKPYPKANEAERALRPAPPVEGGSIPTRSLQPGVV